MERRTQGVVREVMIPHLEATLAMEWSSPPPDVTGLLDGGAAVGPTASGPGSTDQQSDLLVRRCGATAVATVAARVGVGGALTWRDIVEVQTAMLGREACFRRGDARTVVRSERYALLSDLESMFVRKVEADAEDSAHDALKGIRLYLDLLFVHPFEDGNARAALLWLVYFYWRSGRRLPQLARLHRFEFNPGDRASYWMFVRLVLTR